MRYGGDGLLPISRALLNAVTAAKVIEKLGLHNLRDRQWAIQSACAEPAISHNGSYGFCVSVDV